jgi:hypothetical protein
MEEYGLAYIMSCSIKALSDLYIVHSYSRI